MISGLLRRSQTKLWRELYTEGMGLQDAAKLEGAVV